MKKSTERVVQKDVLGSSFSNSWGLMWKNKSLFLPDVFNTIITLFLVIIFLVINGMTGLLKVITMDKDTSNEFIMNILKDNFSKSSGRLFLTGLVLFLIIVFIGVMFSCIKYLMMKQIATKKTVSFKEANKNWKEYFWGFIGLNLLTSLIVLGVVLAGIFIYVILNALVPKTMTVLSVILTVVFIFALIFTIAYFLLGLLYAKAIYFIENTRATEAINKSFKFFKENTKHVVLAVFIIVGIGIGFNILINIFSYFPTSAGSVFWLFYSFVILSALFGIVQNVWSNLFLFLTWKK